MSKLTFGSHNGKEIFVFTLKNKYNTTVTITNYGAIIMALKVMKSDDTFNDIVLGFDNPSQYWSDEYLKNYPYYGAAIGRYGNRINNASFDIDGQKVQLNSGSPSYQLHGGIEGFDKKVWDLVSENEQELVLQYISVDGEEGFPGNLTVQIKFVLNDDNELSYEYTATTDAPTAVNLTHHSYFNLNNGEGDIQNQKIKINASQYLEQDSNYCTTGKLLTVANTRNDFSNYQTTGAISNPENGMDISFQLNQQGIEHVAAEAYCDEQDIKLQIFTTEPIVHLYNSYGSPRIIGKNNTQYDAFSAFCLETQVHPNAVNISNFPNTILRPGETYHTKTIYKILKK